MRLKNNLVKMKEMVKCWWKACSWVSKRWYGRPWSALGVNQDGSSLKHQSGFPEAWSRRRQHFDLKWLLGEEDNLVLYGSNSLAKLNSVDLCSISWDLCFGARSVVVRRRRSGRCRRIHYDNMLLVKSCIATQVEISLMAYVSFQKIDNEKLMAMASMQGVS
eukprot:c30520_g1_i1 orf=3-485(-)